MLDDRKREKSLSTDLVIRLDPEGHRVILDSLGPNTGSSLNAGNDLITIVGAKYPNRQPRQGHRGMAVDFLLIDTSVLSEARKPSDLNEDILFFLRQIPAGGLAVPHAAIFELQRGALNLEKTDPARSRAYIRWIDALLKTDIWLPPVNAEVRRLMASMASVPALQTFWVSSSHPPKMKFGCDPEIAATAIVHGLPIASTDVSDYLRISMFFPLPGLYCPRAGKWHIAPPDGWCIGESLTPRDADWRQVIGPLDWGRTADDDKLLEDESGADPTL